MRIISFVVISVVCLLLVGFIATNDLEAYNALPTQEQTVHALVDALKGTILSLLSIILGFLLSIVPKWLGDKQKDAKAKYDKYYAYDLIIEHLENTNDPILSKLRKLVEEDEAYFKYGTWNVALTRALRGVKYTDRLKVAKAVINDLNQIRTVKYSLYDGFCVKCSSPITGINLSNTGAGRAKLLRCPGCDAQYKAFVTDNGRFRLKRHGDYTRFPIKGENWRTILRVYLELMNDSSVTKEEFTAIANAIVSEVTRNNGITAAALVRNLRERRQLTDNIRDVDILGGFISMLHRAKTFTLFSDGKVFYSPENVSIPAIAKAYIIAIVDALMTKMIHLTFNDVDGIASEFLPTEYHLSEQEVEDVCKAKGIRV